MQKKKFVEENLQVIYQSKQLDFDQQKKITKAICANDLKKEMQKISAYRLIKQTRKRLAEQY